jgi:PhzF family phenazine biosynthesis protein
MCGHATLASAFILFEDGHVDKKETISFHTLSGILKAKYDNGWIELDFPALTEKPVDDWPELTRALGCEAVYIGRSRFDCLVETDSEETVRNLHPDFMALNKLDARGFMVTAKGRGEYDFVSRFFAPAVGILEDPVTGSAHCLLGPYWMKKLGKNSFTACQASKRGGVVHLQVKGDRVLLKGQVVVTIRAQLV